MATQIKVLCKIKKTEIEPLLPELLCVITPAKFVCIKCLRTARGKKWLCKAKKLT
jgi:hypothetical protein